MYDRKNRAPAKYILPFCFPQKKEGIVIKIKWYGTASIMLESCGTNILFDPFLKRWNPRLPSVPLEEIAGVSAIFITHPHLDHFADIDTVMQHCPAPVYVADRGIQSAKQAGYDIRNMISLHAGETFRIGGFTVEVCPSRHCVFDLKLVLNTLKRIKNKPSLTQGLEIERLNKLFPIGKSDVFAFDVKADGKEIFLLGSAGTAPEFSYPKGMDLLIFPYQGRSDMSAYSLPFLDLFCPKRVMLDHFDDAFPPISQRMDCAPFMQAAGEKYPDIEIFEPTENIWYDI